MKSIVLLSLIAFAKATNQAGTTALKSLVCQQCDSRCGSDYVIIREPRVGRSGPREIRGPADPQGRQDNIGSRGPEGARGGLWPNRMGKKIFCDMTTDGGNWTVFQRRMDGSVDFYRNWNDYVAGFGNLRGEYWLGLEAIHQLTKRGRVELRIDMIDIDGNSYYAKYSNFRIGSSSGNYRLAVSGFSGNVTDRLSYHNKQRFTTKDRDNDRHSFIQCAHYKHGAWWYKYCADSNLNGGYGRTDHKGIYWLGKTMRFTEMKLRKKI